MISDEPKKAEVKLAEKRKEANQEAKDGDAKVAMFMKRIIANSKAK